MSANPTKATIEVSESVQEIDWDRPTSGLEGNLELPKAQKCWIVLVDAWWGQNATKIPSAAALNYVESI